MGTEIDTREGDDDAGLLKRTYRTVTPGYTSHEDGGMNAIGWAVFLGMLALLFPLLPFVAAVWLVSKGLEAIRGSDHGAAE